MNVEAVIKTQKEIPLKKRTIIHLSLVTNMINEQMAAALKPYGISIQQFNVLRILRGQNGNPANLSTINERMVTKMSNTTRLVDKLLAKGMVERTVCKKNRRKVDIYITEKGLQELSKMDGILFDLEERMLKGLDYDELMELNRLLDKF